MQCACLAFQNVCVFVCARMYSPHCETGLLLACLRLLIRVPKGEGVCDCLRARAYAPACLLASLLLLLELHQ